jgi:hypothetical protein
MYDAVRALQRFHHSLTDFFANPMGVLNRETFLDDDVHLHLDYLRPDVFSSRVMYFKNSID